MRERLILFVCTGNVCRSPMATCLFSQASALPNGWNVASAGVAAFGGLPASAPAVTVMAARGLDLRSHSSQPVTAELVDRAYIILTMTRAQKHTVVDRFPMGADKIYLIRDFDAARTGAEIADPIGGSVEIYADVADEIDAALPGLLAFLREQLHGDP